MFYEFGGGGVFKVGFFLILLIHSLFNIEGLWKMFEFIVLHYDLILIRHLLKE